METAQLTTARGRGNKRITNACLRCQSRKIRCDGELPACSHCVKQKLACNYTERRRRGPGKSTQYIQMLEERMSKLESSLHNADPTQAQGHPVFAQAFGQNTRNHPIEVNDSSPNISEDLPNNADHVPDAAHGTPLPTTTKESESLEPKGISLQSPITQKSQRPLVLPPIMPHVRLFQSQLDTAGFRRKLFMPLHAKSFLTPYTSHALEDVNSIYPFFTSDAISALLQQQYIAGPENCNDNPPRWALLNALIATAIQWKVEQGSFYELIPIAWGHFKNSFSIFPELLIRGTGISTCQALLAMATFMRGTADSRTTASLTASVGATMQAFGLHTRDGYRNLDLTAAEEHRRVFWLSYIFENEEMMRQGLPPKFGSDEADVELPMHNPPDGLGDYSIPNTQKKINILRRMAELTVIQSQIFSKLYSKQVLERADEQLHGAIAELNDQLDKWKMDLPSEIQPTLQPNPKAPKLEMPIIWLTICYYTTLARIHKLATSVSSTHHPGGAHGHSNIPLQAARATIRLLRRGMPPHAFVLTWQIMHHAVNAILTLFTSILREPHNAEVELDTGLIADFVRVVKQLEVVYGCDLRNLFNGCAKIQEMAQNVVSSNGAVLNADNLPADTHLGQWTPEQYVITRQKLLNSAHPMQLTQGLMGNIPALCSKAADVFSEVFDMHHGGEQTYGLFVPESLKPETFDFTFGLS